MTFDNMTRYQQNSSRTSMSITRALGMQGQGLFLLSHGVVPASRKCLPLSTAPGYLLSE